MALRSVPLFPALPVPSSPIVRRQPEMEMFQPVVVIRSMASIPLAASRLLPAPLVHRARRALAFAVRVDGKSGGDQRQLGSSASGGSIPYAIVVDPKGTLCVQFYAHNSSELSTLSTASNGTAREVL